LDIPTGFAWAIAVDINTPDRTIPTIASFFMTCSSLCYWFLITCQPDERPVAGREQAGSSPRPGSPARGKEFRATVLTAMPFALRRVVAVSAMAHSI
jgi:hypothetical protein